MRSGYARAARSLKTLRCKLVVLLRLRAGGVLGTLRREGWLVADGFVRVKRLEQCMRWRMDELMSYVALTWRWLLTMYMRSRTVCVTRSRALFQHSSN